MAVSQPMSRPLEPQRQSVAKPWRALAYVAALYVGGVHLALAQDRYELDARWIGVVFTLGALVLIIAGGVAASGDRWGKPLMWLGWSVSAVVCATFFVLFVLSRTAGLPGYHHGDWPPEQIVALALELAYVAIALLTAVQSGRTTQDQRP